MMCKMEKIDVERYRKDQPVELKEKRTKSGTDNMHALGSFQMRPSLIKTTKALTNISYTYYGALLDQFKPLTSPKAEEVLRGAFGRGRVCVYKLGLDQLTTSHGHPS